MIHIIGAGPAGISLAYYAYQKGVKKITLYERTNFIGGMSRSWAYNNFILDTGPHIFLRLKVVMFGIWRGGNM